MSQLNDDEKRRLFQTLDKHTEQNDKIERGLYGDKPNKVKGALDTIEDLKTEIIKINTWINKYQLKTAYLSGAVAGVILYFKYIWDWFMAHITSGKQ